MSWFTAPADLEAGVGAAVTMAALTRQLDLQLARALNFVILGKGSTFWAFRTHRQPLGRSQDCPPDSHNDRNCDHQHTGKVILMVSLILFPSHRTICRLLRSRKVFSGNR